MMPSPFAKNRAKGAQVPDYRCSKGKLGRRLQVSTVTISLSPVQHTLPHWGLGLQVQGSPILPSAGVNLGTIHLRETEERSGLSVLLQQAFGVLSHLYPNFVTNSAPSRNSGF